MARVLDRNNLVRALKQVQRNKGAPGVDGMTVDDLPAFLKQYWPTIRQQLISVMFRRRYGKVTFSRRELKVKVSDKALMKLKATVKQLSRRTRGHSITQVIAELRKSLLGWVDFCSCKIKLSTIHGGQSVFRYIRNTESPARFGQMDSTTIAVLYLETVGTQRVSNAQAQRSRPEVGMEYRQVSPWSLAIERQSGIDQSTSQ